MEKIEIKDLKKGEIYVYIKKSKFKENEKINSIKKYLQCQIDTAS